MTEEQERLLAIVHTWQPSAKPEMRDFRCAACQNYMTGEVWHRWLISSEFRTPVHLCDSCDPKFRTDELTLAPAITGLNREDAGYVYPPEIAEQFRKIFFRWPVASAPVRKQIVCDDCNQPLPETKGYHVWWNDRGVLTELHFDLACAAKFGTI
ncbi:MAG: hypothetical protein HY978_00685 [Candidatus Liptonbacteria bacterium]|nr:hypothetical protein [Candidatus Liptonbacteria bacterium]